MEDVQPRPQVPGLALPDLLEGEGGEESSQCEALSGAMKAAESGVPSLTIRFKKQSDGRVALSCTRADGTVTWQRQAGAQAAFFPRHDLTHYAVETVLGHRRGFYGLVAEGWDFGDFGTPWPRGPLPLDTDPSELIVGFLDLERAGGVEWTAADFADRAAAYYADHGLAGRAPTITDAQLKAIRARARELFTQWEAVAPGAAMELRFDIAGGARN